MHAMSAARKPQGAAKPDKTPATSKAKAGPKDKSKTPAKKPAISDHETLLRESEDAKLTIFGAADNGTKEWKAGDRFVVPIWSVKLVEELATVVLGRRTSKTNPAVYDAQFALLMLAIPAYIARARHDNETTAPYDGFVPDPQLHQAACDSISGLMQLGLFDEAQILIRALQRLQAMDETWNSPDFGNKRLLKAIAVRIDLAMQGKEPTKKKLREVIYGEGVAESQVSREFKKITGLSNLRRAKSGPKPVSIRGGKTPIT
jgi:hypothetical protein